MTDDRQDYSPLVPQLHAIVCSTASLINMVSLRSNLDKEEDPFLGIVGPKRREKLYFSTFENGSSNVGRSAIKGKILFIPVVV